MCAVSPFSPLTAPVRPSVEFARALCSAGIPARQRVAWIVRPLPRLRNRFEARYADIVLTSGRLGQERNLLCFFACDRRKKRRHEEIIPKNRECNHIAKDKCCKPRGCPTLPRLLHFLVMLRGVAWYPRMGSRSASGRAAQSCGLSQDGYFERKILHRPNALYFVVAELSDAILHRPVGIRVGQAWFNRLNELRPDLAKEIRGGILDPFYADERLPAAWDWLMQQK